MKYKVFVFDEKGKVAGVVYLSSETPYLSSLLCDMLKNSPVRSVDIEELGAFGGSWVF